MSDKSPRKTASKKSGKSLKEKRAGEEGQGADPQGPRPLSGNVPPAPPSPRAFPRGARTPVPPPADAAWVGATG